jgi:hypothetical protein
MLIVQANFYEIEYEKRGKKFRKNKSTAGSPILVLIKNEPLSLRDNNGAPKVIYLDESLSNMPLPLLLMLLLLLQ